MILHARALTRSFRGRPVLGPVDFELGAGERLAVTGENGSGKSTLLRLIGGTLTPSTGTVSVHGAPAASRAAKRSVGSSFSQERSFYLRLSGHQNLLAFARIRAGARGSQKLVEDVVGELELAQIAERRVDRCSTGMVQQLAFARALLGDPVLLVLDEPTRSLDEGAFARLWEAIERRPASAVIIATHRHEDIERCGRRLALSGS